MPEPAVPLQDIPQFEFDGEGVFFDTDSCNHGAVEDGTPEADSARLIVDGLDEDHLLAPYVLYPETFSEDLLLAERESSPAPEPISVAASNPAYQGPSYEYILKQSKAESESLDRKLVGLRSDPEAYMRLVREIGDKTYYVSAENTLPTNPKLAKGVKHGWRTEGVVLAPNVLAGLGDVCPFSSPLCTAKCLNLSGQAEAGGPEGVQVNCRRRRTLMFMHMNDAFQVRAAGLIHDRSAKMPGRYAVRLNVMSDLRWENLKFFNPWTGEETTLMKTFPNVQYYDYTKNCQRYQSWLLGELPRNYHLTFSMSEINALYAIYALVQGGSVTVVFDAMTEHGGGGKHYARYPAEPLPRSFCGFPVIDGDQTDLRFEDRERFGVPKGRGFIVGLRLKGTKHRREYNQDKAASAGFIFDAKRKYTEDYIPELIASSERRRLVALHNRQQRDLPGMVKQKFLGIPGPLVSEAKRSLGL